MNRLSTSFDRQSPVPAADLCYWAGIRRELLTYKGALHGVDTPSEHTNRAAEAIDSAVFHIDKMIVSGLEGSTK